MTDPATARAQKHMLGFAMFGWAWPVLAIAWTILGWMIEMILIAALAAVEAARWVRLRFR